MGHRPGRMRSTVERQPFVGKDFHCSMCRASRLGPLFLAGPKTLFAIYVIVKLCTDPAKQALSAAGRQGCLEEKCCLLYQASSVGDCLLSLTDC